MLWAILTALQFEGSFINLDWAEKKETPAFRFFVKVLKYMYIFLCFLHSDASNVALQENVYKLDAVYFDNLL